ncbi:DJ-1/PfpI family protein [Dokdonella sp.]|uniref:DJ-1/PfpI family protein n=1 Tax=Dokdonella sp. TaxID=2291710 RepID=UPI003C3251BB
MKLSIVLFDGLTTLDAIGGYEVLSRLPGIEVEFIAASRGLIVADTRRLGLLAFRDLDETPRTDILYVPGGPGGRILEKDPVFLETLRRLDNTSTWTIGICNGVTLLACAGLLEGRKVTTNWHDRERMLDYRAQFVAERYFRDGKYLTGAGVSASIDTALYFAQLTAGESVAQAIQFGIEYYPAPPLPGVSPADAPIAAQHAVQQFEMHQARTLLGSSAPFAGISLQWPDRAA